MILWSGPFYDISGYGTATRDYVKGLKESGADINAFPIKYDMRGSNTKFINDLDYYTPMFVDQDSWPIDHSGKFNFVWHSSPNVAKAGRFSKKNILMTVWETDHVPEEFGFALNQFDHIITASEFSKQAFLNTFPDLNISVVPHMIHDYETKFKPDEDFLDKIRPWIKDKFVFIWNAEWHIGKGYDQLLRGFCEEFKNDEDVLLILKTYNLSRSNYKEEVILRVKQYKGSNKLPKILPLVGDLLFSNVLSLYSLANAYINTSRREGFSLTTAEALGFGLPVIAPDKGGHTEFLNSNNSFLVKSDWMDVSGVELKHNYYKNQKWIEMNLDDFKQKLRRVYKNRTQNRSDYVKFQNNIHDTIKQFSPLKVTKKLTEEIYV